MKWNHQSLKYWGIKVGLTAIGLMIGLLYWHKIGCGPDACAINGNPYIMGGMGALLGFSFGNDLSKYLKKRKNANHP